MSKVQFFRLTQKQYDLLENKDPDAVYLTEDTRMVYLGSRNYSHGIHGRGHITGGYCAGISAYSEANNVFTITLMAINNDDLDMTKFQIGQPLYLNIPDAADTENGEDLQYQTRTIQNVDANKQTITLDASIYNANVTEIVPDECFCMVNDPERDDNATTYGDKNYVTGVRAHAHGSWNSVTGMCAEASGIENIASGIAAKAQGTHSIASGNSSHAEGIKTIASGFCAHAQGSTTKATGDTSFAGGTATVASGNNSYVWGVHSTAEGDFSCVHGTNCTAKGINSTAIGYNVHAEAARCHIIGMNGKLEATLENEGAIAFAGGTWDELELPFIFRMKRAIVNPEYDAALDPEQSGVDSNGQSQHILNPAYSMIYSGRIKPVTMTSDAAELILNHDLYSRWTAEAQSVSLSLQNWEDGDYGEVVFSGELILPDEWIKCNNMTNNYPKNILQIEKIGENVFCQLKYKEQQ